MKDSQTKFVQQQIKIEQIKETEDDVKEGYEKIQDELNTIKKKCDSTEKKLNVCNAEKVNLSVSKLFLICCHFFCIIIFTQKLHIYN